MHLARTSIAIVLMAACTSSSDPDRLDAAIMDANVAPISTDTRVVQDVAQATSLDAAAAVDARHADVRGSTAVDGGGRTCESMEPTLASATGTQGRVCVESVPDLATWQAISLPENAVDVQRSTCYFLPHTRDANIPPSFLDSSTWKKFPKAPGMRAYAAWHLFFGHLFLAGPIPDVYLGTNRKAIAGIVVEVRTATGDTVFAYSIQGESLGCDEEKKIHAEFQRLFQQRPLFRLLIEGSERQLATPPPTGCAIPVFVLR